MSQFKIDYTSVMGSAVDVLLQKVLHTRGSNFFSIGKEQIEGKEKGKSEKEWEEADTWAFSWMPPLTDFTLKNKSQQDSNDPHVEGEIVEGPSRPIETEGNRSSDPVHNSSYNVTLLADKAFYNPFAAEAMAAAFGISAPLSYSVKVGLSSEGVDGDMSMPGSGLFYEELRDRQDRIWADSRLAKGIALARSGHPNSALRYYDQALSLCPDHVDAITAKGAALASSGRLAAAVSEFRKALDLEPENANASTYLTATLEKLNRQQATSAASSTAKSTKISRANVASPVIGPPVPPGSNTNTNVVLGTDRLLMRVGAGTGGYAFVGEDGNDIVEDVDKSSKKRKKRDEKDKEKKSSKKKKDKKESRDKDKKHKHKKDRKKEKKKRHSSDGGGDVSNSGTDSTDDRKRDGGGTSGGDSVEAHPILGRVKHSLWG